MKARRLWFSALVACLVLPFSSIATVVPFGSLTRPMIAGMTIQGTILNGSDSSINQIPTGTVLVYSTVNGYLGKMQILKYGYDLAIKVVTFNADGSILAQADSLIIHGTFSCNLETATEAGSGDFFWHQMSTVLRALEMTSPAKVAVYYTPSNVVTNFTLTPASPATLLNNQHVVVHFSYTTIANHGARIWALPYYNGVLVPGAENQGSVLRPSGSDTSSEWFTIISGIEQVDSVRILMADSAGTTTLFETFIPVSYYFGPNIVTNVVPTPASPAMLGNGQDVNFTFDYAATSAGGVRIFIRPFTNGALSANYDAHGSPLYAVGSGTGTGFFTIVTGAINVDSARVQMWNAAQDTLLFESFLPVNYMFQPNIITNVQAVPVSPAALVFGDSVKVTFSYFANQKVRLFARPWSNGALAPNYAAHGSGLFGAGAGTDSGRAWFTILSGNVRVDSVRVQMWDSTTTTLLQTAYLAVNYSFGSTVGVALQRNQNLPLEYGLTAMSNGTIRFAMPAAGNAAIKVYTCNGRCAATILNGPMTSGYHQVQWDAAKGMYIVRMEVNGHALTSRMAVAK
jgi:hypothetical protein